MTQVLNYLITEHKQPERVAKRTAEKLCKYEDIKAEFLNWLATGEFGEALVIEGYTPKRIAELAPFMNGVGVYTFMVTLRDNPAYARERIASGFPIK